MDEDILFALIEDAKNSVDKLNKTTENLIDETSSVESSISDLQIIIDKANQANNKQSSRMFALTIVIATLTFIMTIAVGIQIYLILHE